MEHFVFRLVEMKLLALLLIFVTVVSLALVGYVVWIVLFGWSVVRSAPREDMFMGEEYCSICFHQKIKQAERGELN